MAATNPSPNRSSFTRRLLAAAAALPAAAAIGRVARATAQELPATVRLDYAYYNPSSLVLRSFGWLEETLGGQGVGVEWVLSAGSNKANEFLR